jgi:hypothetical protein
MEIRVRFSLIIKWLGFRLLLLPPLQGRCCLPLRRRRRWPPTDANLVDFNISEYDPPPARLLPICSLMVLLLLMPVVVGKREGNEFSHLLTLFLSI